VKTAYFILVKKVTKIKNPQVFGDCQKLGVFKNYEIFQKIFFFEKTGKML
jgi:hypothetical protein